ncbi:MAG: restriction endonuclease subunit S, partial [Acidithiobacillus sp.]
MNWPKRLAGDLFDIQLGKMLSEKARTGMQRPYLANFNVRWGRFDLSDLNQMAFSEREQEKFSIQPNDLLMCEGGEIGRCAVWTDQSCSLFYQKALHRLRARDERINPYFMYFYMQHISTKGDLPKLVGETSIAHLTREKLVDLPVPTPPRAVQDEIVEVLMIWESSIEKTEHLIAAKERHYSHELSWLISRGQHPHDHIGAFTEEVSARNRGGQWRIVALSDIATVWKGQQLNKDAMVEDGAYYALNGGIKPSGRTTEWNCEADTITVSEGGNSCGFASYNRENFWCGGHCYALKKLARDVDALYLFHYLKGKQTRLMALRVGSGLPNIQKSDIEAFPVILPDLATQTTIARYLNAMREEIDLLGQS